MGTVKGEGSTLSASSIEEILLQEALRILHEESFGSTLGMLSSRQGLGVAAKALPRLALMMG